MSVLGRIASQGTLVTVYRPTSYTLSDDAAHRTPTAYAAITVDLAMWVDALSLEKREKVFANAQVSAAAGVVAPDAGVLINDRLVATAGPHDGLVWRVEEVKKHRAGSSNDHDELALVSTDETVS